MSFRRTIALLAGASLILAASALMGPTWRTRPSAAAQPRPTDPLALVVSADPLELARVVDRLGDDAVLARLGAPGLDTATLDPAVVMAALRASAWLHAPEEALPRLVEIAAGHDPDLAPSAMLAIVRIAERLTRPDLDAREGSDEPIRAALPALATLGETEGARADLRRAALRARELLRALVEA
ncbi:MAG: hypothetical protein K1X94_35195 [Sandaracinaceae bacterium]|nr:hypothetical protein [Sandaracinaceae bacterium]